MFLNLNFFRVTDYSFAVSGNTWSAVQSYYPDLVPKLLTRGAVFARMSPDQKQMLVKGLQNLGYFVGKLVFTTFHSISIRFYEPKTNQNVLILLLYIN